MRHKIAGLVLLTFALTAPAFADGKLRLMPLGDSITQGTVTQQTYRYPLFQMLIDANIDFDYVGSMHMNASSDSQQQKNPDGLYPDYKGRAFDPDHEGHYGQRTDFFLRAPMEDTLKTQAADIVLLHLGSNDMFQGCSIAETVIKLKKIIDDVRLANPKVKVMLAKIIPTRKDKDNQRIAELNSQMDAIAKDKSTADAPVIVVDAAAGFDPMTMTLDDGVHPNPAGEKHLATAWFKAIQAVLHPAGK